MIRPGKTILAIAAVTTILFSFGVTAQAQMKLGYIRSEYIFQNYEPYKDAQKQLEEYQKKEYDSLSKLEQDLNKKIEDARAKELLMTPEMKQQKMDELTKQREELERNYEDLMNPDTGRMVKKQGELLQPIINKINEVLMRVAKDGQYDFIFDATTGPQGNTILFANEKYDISEKIVEELKKETPAK